MKVPFFLLPKKRPDYHLVRTAIPYLLFSDSLGDFHSNTIRLLSSFASRLSQGNITLRLRPEVCAPDTSIPFCSRKAGYSAHSVQDQSLHTAMQVHILLRTEVAYHQGSTLLHNSRSPQRKGRDLHAIEGRPFSAGASKCAFPQHPPQTGRKKQAPWVSQLCPLKDF